LRTTLRQYDPALLVACPELAAPSTRDCPDALALLERAATPAQGKRLSQVQIAAALRKAGRQRDIDRRAERIRQALQPPHLAAPAVVTQAYGKAVQAAARVIIALSQQIDALSQELHARFEDHPDARIMRSLPGLGPLLGPRILGEFGDAPNRFANAKARKNSATTSPVTRSSGKVQLVNARHGGNRQLGNSCLRFAFSAIQTSPGARRYSTALRHRDKTHAQAIRSVANRMVGILHGCLKNRAAYDETIAWPAVEAGT
jgi:transposase